MFFGALVMAAVAAEGTMESRASRWLGDLVFPKPHVDRSRRGAFDAPPVLQWSVRLPGPPLNAASHTERSRPVVVGSEVLVGSAAGDALYVFDRATGALERSFPAHASVQAEALVADDRVYFADTSGTTWCYTLDGTLVWSHRANVPILTRPTLNGDRLFVATVDDLALALDAATGEQIWRYKAKRDLLRVAELALYAAPPAVIADGMALFGFSSGELVGLDVETGDVRFQRQIGEGRYPDIVAAPVVTARDIFVSGYYAPLVAMQRSSQMVRWRADVGAAFPPHVEDGTIYHPGSDGVLRAFSDLTGALRWSWESGTNTALTTPIPTDAGLLVGASGGDGLFLIDPDTGATVWRWREPYVLEGVYAPPTVVDDQVLFVTNAGRLYSMVAASPGSDVSRSRLWPRRGSK